MVWPIFGDHDVKFEAITHLMSSADDIVVAIIGGTFLEEAVERTLKERMRDNKDVSDRLFDLTKPLSSTSAQIDVLYMLWGIESHVRETMLGICRIRNFFAHNMGVNFDSDDPKFTKHLPKLNLHERHETYPDARFGTPTSKKIKTPKNNRETFIVNLQLCLNYLMQDRCKHIAYSTQLVSYEELRKKVGKPWV
ncbi:MAG TPA: hypothetical protein VGB88_01220 [Alphaproteobacteria bacterium]